MESGLPNHIGYIVDGNRRWAKEKGLAVTSGHQAGYRALKDVAIRTIESGVPYVSVYVFSTENWNRPKVEVDFLMKLLSKVLRDEVDELMDRGVRIRVLGSRDRLSGSILKLIDEAESRTHHNTKGQLLLCLNYGGHQELADAVKQIIDSGVSSAEVTPDLIAQNIYTPDVPACDLIVRTSGEQRLSNFMLWRSAYSELLFIDKNWPDMTTDDVEYVLEEYKKRKRRFGS